MQFFKQTLFEQPVKQTLFEQPVYHATSIFYLYIPQAVGEVGFSFLT